MDKREYPFNNFEYERFSYNGKQVLYTKRFVPCFQGTSYFNINILGFEVEKKTRDGIEKIITDDISKREEKTDVLKQLTMKFGEISIIKFRGNLFHG